MGNIYIVKKDGTLELFNPEKIRRAVTKSASRVLIDFTEDDLNSIVDTLKSVSYLIALLFIMVFYLLIKNIISIVSNT